MAQTFDGAGYVRHNGVVLSDYPISLTIWFKTTVLDSAMTLISLGSSTNWSHCTIYARGDVGADPIQAYVQQDFSNAKSCNTTTGFSSGTWHHACLVAASATELDIYIDGGSKGSDATNRSLNGINRASVGTTINFNTTQYLFTGDAAEAGVYNVALTAADVAALAAQAQPPDVRPESLVAYWDLIRRNDRDLVGGYNFIEAGGGTTAAAHPPIILGAGGLMGGIATLPPAPPPSGSSAATSQLFRRVYYYRRRVIQAA